MSKKKKGGKKGPPEHFTGAKRAFLDGHSSAYLEALDGDRAGEFYNFVTREYIAKFGYTSGATVENPSVQEPSEGDEDEEHGGGEQGEESDMMSREQADAASAEFTKIRAVSHLSI
jgi:hypothetical protein